MSATVEAPELFTQEKQEKQDRSTDSVDGEKLGYHEKVIDGIEVVDLVDVGDVFEDVRAIDMGPDGKERPIGDSASFI